MLTKDRKGKINRQQTYDRKGKEIRVNPSLGQTKDSNHHFPEEGSDL